MNNPEFEALCLQASRLHEFDRTDGILEIISVTLLSFKVLIQVTPESARQHASWKWTNAIETDSHSKQRVRFFANIGTIEVFFYRAFITETDLAPDRHHLTFELSESGLGVETTLAGDLL